MVLPTIPHLKFRIAKFGPPTHLPYYESGNRKTVSYRVCAQPACSLAVGLSLCRWPFRSQFRLSVRIRVSSLKILQNREGKAVEFDKQWEWMWAFLEWNSDCVHEIAVCGEPPGCVRSTSLLPSPLDASFASPIFLWGDNCAKVTGRRVRPLRALYPFAFVLAAKHEP